MVTTRKKTQRRRAREWMVIVDRWGGLCALPNALIYSGAQVEDWALGTIARFQKYRKTLDQNYTHYKPHRIIHVREVLPRRKK